MVTIHADPVPLEAWPDGSIRVGGTRLLLDLLVAAHEDGLSAGEIVEAYPGVQPDDVHGAVAYYLRHRDEIRAYLDERERQADEVRSGVEADPASAALREKLRRARQSAS